MICVSVYMYLYKETWATDGMIYSLTYPELGGAGVSFYLSVNGKAAPLLLLLSQHSCQPHVEAPEKSPSAPPLDSNYGWFGEGENAILNACVGFFLVQMDIMSTDPSHRYVDMRRIGTQK